MKEFVTGKTYKVTTVSIVGSGGKTEDITSFVKLQTEAASIIEMAVVEAKIGLIGSGSKESLPGVGSIGKMTNGDLRCFMVGDGKIFECVITKRGSDKMSVTIKSIKPVSS